MKRKRAQLQDLTESEAYYAACQDGDLEQAERLLSKRPAFINFSPLFHCGETGVLAAIRNGHVETVRYLIRHPEFDPTCTTIFQQNCLHHACEWGQGQVVECLLESGLFDINQPCLPDGSTALHLAVLRNNLDCVLALLGSRGRGRGRGRPALDVDAVDRKGRTALWLACQDGYHRIVAALLALADKPPDLSLRAHPGCGTKVGATALEMAAYQRSRKGDVMHPECARLLEEHVADPLALRVKLLQSLRISTYAAQLQVLALLLDQQFMAMSPPRTMVDKS